MLRRLEKGLNTAKLKSQSIESGRSLTQDRGFDSPTDGPYSANTHFPSNQLPPLHLSSYPNGNGYAASSSSSRMDEDEEPERSDELYPAKLIGQENRRHSFFRTILNPEETPAGPSSARSSSPLSQPNNPSFSAVEGVSDPISLGFMDEEQAKVLFDLIFIRLNPFINLFDPSLHSVPYVRKKSPFLCTVLIMAGCKFFRPELFSKCQKLADELAFKAFSCAWKSVEVIQAFACLTYWREPDENRTWTYIGYACRMAVELGLNRYVPQVSLDETDLQKRERRNRERTYLILFVHDRSLSMQTGRNWMLLEDEFIRHSTNWHEQGVGSIRPEDVIVAAFVQLRHIGAETTETFRNSPGSGHTDINHEVVLRNCNGQLTMWMETWERQMQRAGGETFHFAFLSVFRLHVRLFTNSFGVANSISGTRGSTPSVQALSVCYTSAIDSLRILSKEFPNLSMLRYGQDSITIMSAYAAVFLLRLLRNPCTAPQLPEGSAQQINSMISKTADAYHEASTLSPASTSAAYHARFLRNLLSTDAFRSRKSERHTGRANIDPRIQGHNAMPSPIYSHTSSASSHESSFPYPDTSTAQHSSHDSDYASRSSNHTNGNANGNGMPPMLGHNQLQVPEYGCFPHHASKDAEYWKSMFMEIGFGGQIDPTGTDYAVGNGMDEMRAYHDGHHQHQHQHQHPISPTMPYGH